MKSSVAISRYITSSLYTLLTERTISKKYRYYLKSKIFAEWLLFFGIFSDKENQSA